MFSLHVTLDFLKGGSFLGGDQEEELHGFGLGYFRVWHRREEESHLVAGASALFSVWLVHDCELRFHCS